MLQESSKKEKGFTLIELTVSLTILVVVLVLSMSLLFSMQGFANRQRRFAEPRQTARRAIDYVTSNLRAATDGIYPTATSSNPINPNSFVMWYDIGNNPTQASYNNVLDPALAEVGTDIITFGASQGGGSVIISQWNGPGDLSTASSLWVYFRDGCPDRRAGGNDQINMLLFMQATGCQGDPSCQTGQFPCPSCYSSVLAVSDSYGNYSYFQITGYQGSDCVNQYQEIHLNANPGQSNVNPPGNRGVSCSKNFDPNNQSQSCQIGKNVVFRSLRVRGENQDGSGTLQLQQKLGLFDPNVDNPGNNFTPLLDNIEDLQIAYIYSDGTIWNDGINNLADQGYQGGIPPQGDGAGGYDPRDIVNVIGIRVSVTARANSEVPFPERARFFRPASEDRPQSANRDRFFHYRLTETVMIRNRNLGG